VKARCNFPEGSETEEEKLNFSEKKKGVGRKQGEVKTSANRDCCQGQAGCHVNRRERTRRENRNPEGQNENEKK